MNLMGLCGVSSFLASMGEKVEPYKRCFRASTTVPDRNCPVKSRPLQYDILPESMLATKFPRALS